jgi:hypothetical protein
MMLPNVHDDVLCHSESYVPPGAAIQEDDSFFHRNVGGWIAGIRMARVPQVNNHPLRGNRAQRHLLIGSAKRSTDPSGVNRNSWRWLQTPQSQECSTGDSSPLP